MKKNVSISINPIRITLRWKSYYETIMIIVFFLILGDIIRDIIIKSLPYYELVFSLILIVLISYQILFARLNKFYLDITSDYLIISVPFKSRTYNLNDIDRVYKYSKHHQGKRQSIRIEFKNQIPSDFYLYLFNVDIESLVVTIEDHISKS